MTSYIIQKVYDNYSGDIKEPLYVSSDEVEAKTLFSKLQEIYSKLAEAEQTKYDNMPANVKEVNDMLLNNQQPTEEQLHVLDQFYRERQKHFKELAVQLGAKEDIYPTYKLELTTLENTSLEAMLKAL